MSWKNKLYFGDNLTVLREHVSDESVDLVYLDPPFNSNASYNVLFKEKSGERSTAQIQAFDDTWEWGPEADAAYREVARRGDKLGQLLGALDQFLPGTNMMAYLSMMATRLVELHRVLKPTGSLYLHCDPTASHYLKLLLDACFGPAGFRNEIIWKRSLPHGNVSRSYGSIHDVILFYSKGPTHTWTKPHKPYLLADGSFNPEIEETVLDQYRMIEDGTGRRFQATSLLNPNPDRPNLTYTFRGHRKVWRWTEDRMLQAEKDGRLYFPKDGTGIPREKRYLDEQEGIPLQDVWDDIPIASKRERLGYPTQKPEGLLARILESSSRKGDVVLDPFCGCGTTIAVAERLQRKWVGIDITHLAINLIKRRLTDTFRAELSPLEVHGEPVDLAGAGALAMKDRYEFQNWILAAVGARQAQQKKGADRGVDGVKVFFDDKSGAPKRIIAQVKSGGVNSQTIRDLVGTLKREKGEIGVLITLEKPSKPMVNEALAEGFYEPSHLVKRYPRIQILTVEEILNGAEIQHPQVLDVTFARAERKEKGDKQQRLL